MVYISFPVDVSGSEDKEEKKITAVSGGKIWLVIKIERNVPSQVKRFQGSKERVCWYSRELGLKEVVTRELIFTARLVIAGATSIMVLAYELSFIICLKVFPRARDNSMEEPKISDWLSTCRR